jgi:nucleotide-binding universal stress UspA family protein
MRTVLAALDASAAARPVLESALGIADLAGAKVEAVHVPEGSGEAVEWLADRAGVPLRILEGPVVGSLLETLADPAVIMAVFGARSTPSGRRPVGRTALHVLERSNKPVVVVPPEAFGVSPRLFRRLLVPLEGDETSAKHVAASLCALFVGDVDLVVLHVFTNATMPRVLDRPSRDLALWGDEFLARFCPQATSIELRAGSVGSRVAEICAEQEMDLIVLSWSQNSTAGHAAVIRDVLGHALIPVLLLPVESDKDALIAAEW